jgi:hypothetical protein
LIGKAETTMTKQTHTNNKTRDRESERVFVKMSMREADIIGEAETATAEQRANTDKPQE